MKMDKDRIKQRRYSIQFKKAKIKGNKPQNITGFKEYTIFRESHKDICTRDRVSSFVDYTAIVTAIYSSISEKLIKSSEGVFIEDFGYFGVVVYAPNSLYNMYKGDGGEIGLHLNYHSDGLIFSPMFVPIQGKPTFRTFNMDFSFSIKTVKKGLKEEILNGKKYRFNACPFILNDLNKMV